MANLQANLRSQFAIPAALKEYFPLALDDFRQLLISVNRLFHENSGESGYATLFLGNYDDATRRLSYVNCGHLPPLLLHNGGEPFAVERLASTSTVIGLFPALECNVVEKQFAPGDTLIVATDLQRRRIWKGNRLGRIDCSKLRVATATSQHPSF